MQPYKEVKILPWFQIAIVRCGAQTLNKTKFKSWGDW